MFREFEADTKPDPGTPGSAEPEPMVPCDCVCGEPASDGAAEAPAGNKSAVDLRLHYEING